MKAVCKWAAIGFVALLAGCGGEEGTALPPPDDGPAAPAAPAKALTIGTAATLNYGPLDDPDGIGALKVTVTKVSDPLAAPRGDDFVSKGAEPGSRYVAIHARIENTGDRVYNDSLYGSTQLVDDQGNVAEGVQLIGWPCEGAFNATIASRARSSGCEVYELPDERKPARFVLTEGERTLATWDVGG